jgi:hypothetical protein
MQKQSHPIRVKTVSKYRFSIFLNSMDPERLKLCEATPAVQPLPPCQASPLSLRRYDALRAESCVPSMNTVCNGLMVIAAMPALYSTEYRVLP